MTTSGRTVDIVQLLNQHGVSALQFRVVALCFVAAMLDGFDTQAIAFVAPVLTEELAIDPQSMGIVFAAGLIGLMVGALSLGHLSDRVGRKPVILFSCALMGLFALLTVLASSQGELLFYRFMTGLGLGGVMPNINTLTSEYAPARRRALLMTAMFAGFPLGAFLGGIISAPLIAEFGWQIVFIIGGVVPLVLVLVLALWLPESLLYRALRDPTDPHIGRTLARIVPQFTPQPGDHYRSAETPAKASPLLLMQRERRRGTLLLWTIFFSNLLMMYGLLNWLPSVMQQSGLPLEQAIVTAAMMNIGGVTGGICIAALIDRYQSFVLLPAVYLCAALTVIGVGVLSLGLGALYLLVFAMGFCIIGAQFGMNALAVAYYPTYLRATGLGWALAVGRIGAILGPVMIGVHLAAGGSQLWLFLGTAVPGVLAAALVLPLIARLPRGAAVLPGST